MKKLPFFTLFLFFSFSLQAQELCLYIIPAPKPINWRSPQKLLLSYIKNAVIHSPYANRKHPIGHVAVMLKDSTRYAFTGSTVSSFRYLTHKVMHRGWGLGVLFATVDGMLENDSINAPDINCRSLAGDVAFLRFKLNQQTFDRLWEYYSEYQEKGYNRQYNGSVNPRNGGGAGCSAFGMSFIELTGYSSQLPLQDWMINVAIQDNLIGKPLNEEHRANMFSILFTNRWANTSRQKYHVLKMYEPTMMYKWINDNWGKADTVLKAYSVTQNKAKGFFFDLTDISTPTDSIWHNGNYP
ncbi:MAG: hypothetical protein JST82_16310 [Bacteroidetes bacterium]|nr:hypothetical protein [Bacteroidota bacterium]